MSQLCGGAHGWALRWETIRRDSTSYKRQHDGTLKGERGFPLILESNFFKRDSLKLKRDIAVIYKTVGYHRRASRKPPNKSISWVLLVVGSWQEVPHHVI